MEIGVRELKQRLSEILDRAAAGEIIRVTDRGRAKAVITAVSEGASLQAGIDAGWIAAPASLEPPRRVVRARARAPIAQSLTDDRGR